jgi:hypothetical protein
MFSHDAEGGVKCISSAEASPARPAQPDACAWRSGQRSGAASVPRRFAIDLAQELQPLDVGVALLALTDDLPVQQSSVADSIVVP